MATGSVSVKSSAYWNRFCEYGESCFDTGFTSFTDKTRTARGVVA